MIVCLPYEANFLYFCTMKTLILRRLFLIALFAAVFPVATRASVSAGPQYAVSEVAVLDSVPSRKPAEKPGDKKPGDKPEIKEVPKSKRQIRPQAVGERIKIKPPVKVKPNIIKKPVVHIKRGR